MKKLSRFMFLILMTLVVPFSLSACGKSDKNTLELEATNLKYVFDIGEEFSLGNSSSVILKTNGTPKTLSSSDYKITQNFDSESEGIYNISISASGISYNYNVVVTDYSSLVGTIGLNTTLADIPLNENLNLSWKEPETELEATVSTTNYTAIFSPKENVDIEVSLPVKMKNLNLWLNNFPTFESFNYGETPNFDGLNVTPESNGDVLFSAFKANEDGTISSTMVASSLDEVKTLYAGDYYLAITVQETDDYTGIETYLFFTVNKVNIQISADPTNYASLSKVYDGSVNFDITEFKNDFYTLSSDTFDENVLSQIILVVTNARFVNSSVDPTNNSTISATALEVEATFADDELSNSFLVNGSNTVILYFDAEIQKATPEVSENPVASKVIAENQLKSSLLSGGNVVANLFDNLTESIISTQIDGTWSWQNENDVVSENGTFVAVFSPNDTNINQITCSVQVEILEDDGIIALISTNNSTFNEIERTGNDIFYTLAYDVSNFKLKFDIAENSATYVVFYNEIAQSEEQVYTNEYEIIFNEETFNSYNNFKVVLTLTNAEFEGRTITINFAKENVLTLFVNGNESSFDTKINIYDTIDFSLSRPEFELYINGTLFENALNIDETYLAKNIIAEVKNGDEIILSQTLHVQGYFSILIINETVIDVNTANINFEYLPNQTNLVVYFESPYIYETILEYYVNDGETAQSVEGYFISIPLENLNKITINAKVNDEIVFTWTVNISEYQIYENIVVDTGEFDEESNTITITAPTENIVVNLSEPEKYTYSWVDEFFNPIDFSNISSTKTNIILLIYSSNETLVYEQPFTLYYFVELILNDGENNLNCYFDYESECIIYEASEDISSLTISLSPEFEEILNNFFVYDESGNIVASSDDNVLNISQESNNTFTFEVGFENTTYSGNFEII